MRFLEPLLPQPRIAIRKGKERVVHRVQTCWFTGGIISNETKDGDDRWSIEHIVAQSSELYSQLNLAQKRKNTVPAYAHANTAGANFNITLKYELRDRLRRELYGTIDLTTVPIEQRVRWSKELRKLITRVASELAREYRIEGKWFWTNPVVVPTDGTRLWTLENPHHRWTQDELAQRIRALDTLRVNSRIKLAERFIGFEYTDAIDQALRADLHMDDQ